MKKIILFLSVFVFIYPFQPSFSPLELNRVLQIFGVLAMLIDGKDWIRILTNKRSQRFLGLSFGFLVFSVLAELQHSGVETFLVKPINIFLNFFSAYFIYWMTKKTYGEVNFGVILQYIVFVGIAQSLISIIFFFQPDLYDLFLSFTKNNLNNKTEKFSNMLGRRFVGINSNSFGGSIKFGFAFFSLIIMPYFLRNKLVSNKILYGLSLLLIIIGGVFTARTFFVTMGFGLILIWLIKAETIYQFLKLNFKIVVSILVGVPLVYLIISFFVDVRELQNSFRWAFEIFYNLLEGRGLQSSSTEDLKSMYVFPHSIKTWLIGDGYYMNPSGGGYYMGTDVGFLRMIYYFGLPATIYFCLMLIGYCKILSSLSVYRVIKYFFGVIVLWQIFLNVKGMTFNSEYFVLFLLFLTLSSYQLPYEEN